MPFSNDHKVNVKRDFPRGRPEHQLPLYIECLKEKKTIKREPAWDAPPAKVALEISKAEAQIREAEEKLKEVQATKKAKQKVLNAQWADLEYKEEEFKNAFIKYNEFLKENGEKRERCRIKMQVDDEIIKNLDKQIEELQKKYDRMLAVKQQMEDMIKKHQIYENYLGSVVEISNIFKDPTDILRRHDVLMQARELTLNRQEQAINFLENARKELHYLTDIKTETVRIFSDKIARMLSRYQEAQKKSLYWEKILENIRLHMEKSSQEITGVRSAAWNLYKEISHRRGEEMRFEKGDVENHLIYIKRTLKEMETITSRATVVAVKPKKKAKVTMVKPEDGPMSVKVVWRGSVSTEGGSRRSSSVSTIHSVLPNKV